MFRVADLVLEPLTVEAGIRFSRDAVGQCSTSLKARYAMCL